jgi:hypothetical protein
MSAPALSRGRVQMSVRVTLGLWRSIGCATWQCRGASPLAIIRTRWRSSLRRLTLPSRGCPKGYAFCAPLMSNVRHLMSKFKHHSAFQKTKQAQSFRFPHVCLDCRKSFKFPVQFAPRPCPQCRTPMVRLSRKFSAPKSSNVQQWGKVRYLVENGFLFYSASEMVGPFASKRVSYPRTLQEAKLFVERFKSQATPRLRDA